MERTFAIIKPDAVRKRATGRILARIEDAGFAICAMRMIHMSKAEAQGFYCVHRERPFFAGLTDFMSSGPCVVMCLEAPDAIRKWRDLMGATDPAKAAAGTMRKDFGASIDNNATHGSDAPDTAAFVASLGTCLDEVLATTPNDVDALVSRAYVAGSSGADGLAEAEALADRAVAADPTNGNALLLRASLALSAGRLDAAITTTLAAELMQSISTSRW